MNPLITLLTVLVAITPIGDSTVTRSCVPKALWESHPEGVSLALMLKRRSEDDTKGGLLTIYITNTSKTTKTCTIDSSDLGFQIFTLDGKGIWLPLRDYSPKMIMMAAPVPIDPGQTRSHVIELNEEDMELVTTHPVQCRILIFDPESKNKYLVKSSPRILTETTLPPSNK